MIPRWTSSASMLPSRFSSGATKAESIQKTREAGFNLKTSIAGNGSGKPCWTGPMTAGISEKFELWKIERSFNYMDRSTAIQTDKIHIPAIMITCVLKNMRTGISIRRESGFYNCGSGIVRRYSPSDDWCEDRTVEMIPIIKKLVWQYVEFIVPIPWLDGIFYTFVGFYIFLSKRNT